MSPVAVLVLLILVFGIGGGPWWGYHSVGYGPWGSLTGLLVLLLILKLLGVL